MRAVAPREAAAVLRAWLNPDVPRMFAAWHVLMTGNGTCLVDRWPEPNAALLESGGNYALLGQPDAFSPDELRDRVVGFLEASINADLEWPRVILLQREPASASAAPDTLVRRLEPPDARQLHDLSRESAWIDTTWGGPAGLAASGYGWGAFVDGSLVSVACSFFIAERFEDIGVITEPGFRGRGLSPACASALCADIRARGRVPSWSTSPDNTASLRVAEKLGFRHDHDGHLIVIGRSIPGSAVSS